MFKKSLLIMLLMAMFAPWAANAQETYQIGSGTGNNAYIPIRLYSSSSYKYSLSEQIYTAAELTEAGCPAGNIQKIAFNRYTSGSHTRTLEVYMTTTEKTNFTAWNDVVAVTADNKVYDGSVTLAYGSWSEITLETPFAWDGTSNIMILVYDKTGTTATTVNFYSYSYTGGSSYKTQSSAINPTNYTPNDKQDYKNQIKLTIEEATTTPKPKNLVVSTVGASTASLTWDAPNNYTVDNYTYQYKLSTGDWDTPADILGEETLSGLTANLSGLTVATVYDFRVRANYSEGNSAWVEKSFRTAIDVTGDNIYTYGFEDAAELNYWTMTNCATGTNYTGIVSTNGYNNSDHSFRYYYSSSYNPQYLITPLLNASSNGVHVEFYYKGSSASYTQIIKVGYYTDNTESFTFPTDATINVNSTTYQQFQYDFANEGIKYIAIQYDRNGNFQQAYIDDVLISEVPSCITPSDFTVVANSATPVGAQVSWSSLDGNPTYELCYSTENSRPEELTEDNHITGISGTSYTFTTLNANTNYYIWLRANCGGGDYSAWSSSVTFTTTASCPVPTDVVATAIPGGANISWTAGYQETQWQIQYGTGSGLNWDYTMVDEVLDETSFSFTTLDYSTTYRVQVRAYCDTDDQSEWSDYAQFTTMAECPVPTDLQYSLASSVATITWTAGYEETAWNLRYKKNNGNWTVIENVTSNTYPLTVEATSSYIVQVQSACNDANTWSEELAFDTPCDVISSFPFSQDFESLTTTGDIPSCWDNDEGTVTMNTYKWIYSTSNTGYNTGTGSTVTSGHNNSKCVRFNSYNPSSGQYNCLKTPAMNFPAGKTMVLNFWWKNPAGGDLSVYISTDGGTTYATTSLITGLTAQSDWKEEEIELTNYVGAENVVIVFKATSNCGYNDANIYLDDVTISEQNDCTKPKDLAVDSYDNHSATLSWDANGSEGPWQVAYSTTENFDLDDATAYSVATADATPFELTGLTNLNTYYVRVRSICGANYSDWNNNGYQSFTTTATYTAPTITGISEIGDQSATVAWETGDSEETPTHWTVWYKTGDTENTKTVEAANTSTQITGLTAGSAYEVKVRAQSGVDYSAWSTSENFQTAFCAPADQCNISYELTDSYGDGWNGAAIKVIHSENNTLIASLTLESGSSTTGYLALCNNNTYNFVWQKCTGYFNSDSECGFIIRDVNNEIIFEKTTTPTNGDVLSTYTMDCTVETCTRPSDLTADAVHPNSVELSWTNEAGQDAWQIAYSTESFDPNAANFDLTTVSVENADSNPFELEDLDNSQTYYAYVRAVCGTNDYSKWSTTACEFTTQVACPAPTNVHLASRPASNQLAIAWTAGYEETNWNLYYRVAGAEEWGEPVAVATTPAYTITGELSTTYEVKIAAVCSGTEGGVSDVVTFSTPINVTIASSFSENFNQSGCPSGWTAVDAIYNNNTYKWTFGGTLASTSNYGTMYLITPLLHLSDQTPQLTFNQERSSSGGGVSISVVISTTGTDAEDFTETVWSGNTSSLTTSYKSLSVLLSDYAGQDVYIAFKYSNAIYGHYWHIDDVTLTIENSMRTNGDWNEPTNWSAGVVPTAEQNAYVAADALISDEVSVNNITVLNGGSLTIADGGQLKHNNEGVVATVKKNFTGYTNYTGEGNGGYYLIASPVTESLTSQQLTAMGLTPYGNVTGAHYDLYAWDGSQTNEEWQNWENTQNENHHFPLVHYNGYLYANQDNVEVSFTGTLESSENEIGCEVNYNGGGFASLSLWGNPFVCNVYLSSNMEAMAFYRMNDDGDGFIAATGAIKPMEGFFVQAVDKENQMFYINRTQPNSSKNININLSQGESLRDCAIVRFGEGNTLEKFSLSNNTAKLYIPQGTKDYAVVRSNSQGEMPVNFKAEKSGTYTISVEPENVEVIYLHLIDNRTGMDVDLLVNPSYTFEANKGDNANRFRLVFKANTDVEDNTATETFAYFNGSEWVISNMGDATLQVIDMMGRVLRSEQINGNTAVNINETAGIYMLRLVNGENVMVQKVVVK